MAAARRRAVCVNIRQAFVDFGDAMPICCGVRLRQQVDPLAISAQNGLQQRCGAMRRLLGHRSHACPSMHLDGPGFDRMFVQDCAQERALAGPVSSDQGDFLALANGHRGAIEQQLTTGAQTGFVDPQHSGRVITWNGRQRQAPDADRGRSWGHRLPVPRSRFAPYQPGKRMRLCRACQAERRCV